MCRSTFAGPLLLHKAPGCVDGDAVGGGFPLAHRMAFYIKRGFVQMKGPDTT